MLNFPPCCLRPELPVHLQAKVRQRTHYLNFRLYFCIFFSYAPREGRAAVVPLCSDQTVNLGSADQIRIRIITGLAFLRTSDVHRPALLSKFLFSERYLCHLVFYKPIFLIIVTE